MSHQKRQWTLPSKPGGGGGRRRKKKASNSPLSDTNTHTKNNSNSFTNARAMFESTSKPKTKIIKIIKPSKPKTKTKTKPKTKKNIKYKKPPTNITDDDSKNSPKMPSVAINKDTQTQTQTHIPITSLTDLQQLSNNTNQTNPDQSKPTHFPTAENINIDNKQSTLIPISPPPSMTVTVKNPPNDIDEKAPNQFQFPNKNINRNQNQNQNQNQPQNYNYNQSQPRRSNAPNQYSNNVNQTRSNQQQFIPNQRNNNNTRNSGFRGNNNWQNNRGNIQNQRQHNYGQNYNQNQNQPRNPNNYNQNRGNMNNQYNNRNNYNQNNRNNYNQNRYNQNQRNNNFNRNNRNNNQQNRGHGGANNNQQNVNYNYKPQNRHNRDDSNTSYVSHSRVNTNGMDNNIQWNYSGSKTKLINDTNTAKIAQNHHRNQSQSQSQSQSKSQSFSDPFTLSQPPRKQPQFTHTLSDDDWWYYVDPHDEKVSDRMVNKYELKDMFVNNFINEHCLVWNDLYTDYVTISQVSHLLNFFYDDASDRRRSKKKPPPLPNSKMNLNLKQKNVVAGKMVKKSRGLVVQNGEAREGDNVGNWETLFTADGKPYYKNLVNQQIEWSKPRCLRGSGMMKIMINSESIRNINKAGVAVTKAKSKPTSPISPISVTSPTSPSSPTLKPLSPTQKRINKREEKELIDFKENVGDVRWIPHSKDGFVIAQFVKRDGKYSIYQPFDDSDLFVSESNTNKKKIKRKAIKIPSLKVKKNGLSITNWEYMDKAVSDMVELPDLSAPYVLHNLKHRFLNHQIYTWVGEIMISINPYELLPLYLPSVLEDYRFQQNDKHALPPHIYDIARKCYNNIISLDMAQSIIISGESGSGKTECTKQILQFIAECAGNDNKIEQKLLSTNPILESFGNCRTVRNNNSSRFGKYIEIYFNNSNQIIQSNNNQIIKSFQTIYMLEKVRVCKKSKEERNYHIFYQLIKCEDLQLKKSLKLGKVSNYAYLQGTENAPGINDGDDFIHLNKAFKDIGCFAADTEKNTVFNIYKLCSAILWIGNILFEQDDEVEDDNDINRKGHSCKISAKSTNAVRVVCNLLDIANVSDLTEALMYKSIQFGGKNSDNSQNNDVTQIGLSKNKAFENRDALAKFLYNELFTWIVNKLNEYLIDKRLIKQDNERMGINFGYKDEEKEEKEVVKKNNYRIMGVLDIFGFEILTKNSFEQLCINYTNERLQYQFDQTVFRNEENLYEREGIEFSNSKYIKFNNLAIIELIDAKKIGIFSILDAQSSVPQSDDTTFMITLNQMHDIPSESEIYEKYPKKPNNFIIHHYAGKVQYDARGFVNKNRDSLNTDLLKLLDKSRMELIRNVIGPTIKENLNNKKLNKTKLSASKLYTESLNILINKLSFTQTHYIRCIKPNDIKTKNCWMGKLVLDQLKYSGIFEAIKVKKNGYPFRGLHKEFIDRFKLMATHNNLHKINELIANNEIIACVEMMSQDLLDDQKEKNNFVIGKTMIFYQQKEHEIMEKKRELAFNSHVCLIQNAFRMFRERKDFNEMKKVKPKLMEAIRTRNINLLNSAISDAVNINFAIKLVIDAKNLRVLIHKEQQCEQHIKYILHNNKTVDLSQYVQDLSRALAEADEIGYYSPTVQHARLTLEQFTSHAKIKKQLKLAIKDFEIEAIKHGLERANFANIPGNDPLIMEAKNTLKFVDREKDLLIKLQKAFEFGGYLKTSNIIDYSFARRLDIDVLTDVVRECHQFKLKTKYGLHLLKKTRHIMQLRIALKKALLGRNNNELWNIVVNVINNSILVDMPEMTTNKEIIAANQIIYIYFRDSFSEKFAETLQDAINRMDYDVIKMKLNELYHDKKQYELSGKYTMLVERGKELVIEMESINNYLQRGLAEKNMNLLSHGINRADDIGYTENKIFISAHLFYTQYGTFDVRLAAAIQEFDIDTMKLLLDECEQYENKKNDPKIIQIRNLIFNTSFEKLLQLQLNAAVSQRDPIKVCKITLKLKKLFFEKNENKFEWKLYPLLLSPESWAKTAGIFAKKTKLKKSFYNWTNNPIHHSLTDLSHNQQNKRGKNRDNNYNYLKKSSCEMFKNIMGIMGDRHYQQPLSLIQDILIKIQDFIPLRNEFYAQIIKQLTKNPNKDSRMNGWNLLIVILDTLKPPKDIENYLEKWLRDNKPPQKMIINGDINVDNDFYVRLLHQTIFLGSRNKIPTLHEIQLLMSGKGIRSLKKPKKKQASISTSRSIPNIINKKLAYSKYNNKKQTEPPKLTSIHEGKLQQQRMTLQWKRTVENINKFEQNEEKNQRQPGAIDSDDFRNKIYYCGYTMDDERRPGNNFHYPNAKLQPGAIAINMQPGQSQKVRNVPNSVTDPVKDYNNILDL